MKYFHLFSDIFFERGAVNGALYDITHNRVLPLSPLESHILYQCEHNVSLDQLEGVGPEQVDTFLEKLTQNQLGQYHDTAVRVEKYLPSLNLSINGLVEPPFMLNSVYLQLTSACNLRCTDCGRASLPVWQGCNTCERWPGVTANTQWNPTRLEQVIDELLQYTIANVFIIGGNPLLEPQLLLNTLAHLRQKTPPINIIIITNGAGLTEEILETLTPLKIKFYFVMLGMNPEEYKKNTGSEQGFADLVNAIFACQRYKIPYAISIVVRPETSDKLAERKQWAEQMGAQRVFFAEHVIQSSEGNVAPLKVLATTGPGRVKGVNAQQFFLRREANTCLSRNIAIAVDGTARPCPMLPQETIGDLSQQSLRELFASREHQPYWQLTKDQVTDCRQCEFRYGCLDCAVIDLQIGSNPNMRRAVCSYHPTNGEWITN